MRIILIIVNIIIAYLIVDYIVVRIRAKTYNDMIDTIMKTMDYDSTKKK